MTFNLIGLHNKIEKIKQNYSNILVHFLVNMTKEHAEERLDFQELNEQMDKILKMNNDEVERISSFCIYIYSKEKKPHFSKKNRRNHRS